MWIVCCLRGRNLIYEEGVSRLFWPQVFIGNWERKFKTYGVIRKPKKRFRNAFPSFLLPLLKHDRLYWAQPLCRTYDCIGCYILETSVRSRGTKITQLHQYYGQRHMMWNWEPTRSSLEKQISWRWGVASHLEEHWPKLAS